MYARSTTVRGDPAAIDELPPDPVRFGVPMFTHTVPSEATALPKASWTAFAMLSIALPTALFTQSCTTQPVPRNPQSCPAIGHPTAQAVYPARFGS